MDWSFQNADPITSFPSLFTSIDPQCLLEKAHTSQPGVQVLTRGEPRLLLQTGLLPSLPQPHWATIDNLLFPRSVSFIPWFMLVPPPGILSLPSWLINSCHPSGPNLNIHLLWNVSSPQTEFIPPTLGSCTLLLPNYSTIIVYHQHVPASSIKL